MRAQITVTTESGIVYAGEVELLASTGPRKSRKAKVGARKEVQRDVEEIDFSLPVRPFIKKYSNGMSRVKRLALLVARIAEGNIAVEVQRSEVRRLWSTMTSLMGGPFNPAYETRAKDNGWIGSPERGLCTLLAGWKEIFSA